RRSRETQYVTQHERKQPWSAIRPSPNRTTSSFPPSVTTPVWSPPQAPTARKLKQTRTKVSTAASTKPMTSSRTAVTTKGTWSGFIPTTPTMSTAMPCTATITTEPMAGKVEVEEEKLDLLAGAAICRVSAAFARDPSPQAMAKALEANRTGNDRADRIVKCYA